MFLTSPLKICGEVELRIHQHLMGRMHGLEKIERVCSHQQSLAQCRQWLDEHLPNAERMPVSSNAEAARRARDEDGHGCDRRTGGGGSLRAERHRPGDRGRAGQHHALPRDRPQAVQRQRQRQDHAAGVGRRYAVARRAAPAARAARAARISMTRIESRPSRRRKWDYVFFIDVVGHADEASAEHGARRARRSSPRCSGCSGRIRARCCEAGRLAGCRLVGCSQSYLVSSDSTRPQPSSLQPSSS